MRNQKWRDRKYVLRMRNQFPRFFLTIVVVSLRMIDRATGGDRRGSLGCARAQPEVGNPQFPVVRMRRTYFRSRLFWLRMRTRSRPVAHAHAITFGSTTTTHVALSVLIYYSCQCRNKARKLSGHVYLCKVYRFGLFLRFFDWILEMFRQYSIFFSILFHVKSHLKYGK
jgi:hypothetical protein